METGEQHAVCVLCWEDLEVAGPTATWVRETLQNMYSMHTDYLRKQSAGLFRSQAPQDDVDCEALVGSSSVWMARSGM
jgi:hypothetical protein